MENLSVDEALAALEAGFKLLKKKPSTPTYYVTPVMVAKVYSWFDDRTFDHSINYRHIYLDEIESCSSYPVFLELTKDTTSVIHNHHRHETCFTPLKCFRYGYKPTGAEHPGFISDFNYKNGRYYNEQAWNMAKEKARVALLPNVTPNRTNLSIDLSF